MRMARQDERENSSTVDLFDCCKKNRLLDAKVSKDTVYAKPLQYEMSAVVVVCIVSSQSNIKHNSNNKQKKNEGMKETQKIIIKIIIIKREKRMK